MQSETLRQLIVNCRKSDGRYLGFPRDWQPYAVQNPNFEGYSFTDNSAFEFIADLLEAGHVYEEMLLDNPKGAIGVVLKVKISDKVPVLYVKLQLGKGSVAIGRSFHYSDF